MIAEITGKDFEQEVLGAALPVFTCFTNSQCRTCFALCLVVEDLAGEYDGRVKFAMIDVEKEPELATRYRILPLPAVLLFQGSEPVKKLLGFYCKGELRELLDRLIAENGHSVHERVRWC